MSTDSETVEDTERCNQTAVTDDSSAVSEVVPLDRTSDDYHTSELIDDKPGDPQEVDQEEPADENGDSHDYVKQELISECETETTQVSSAVCMHTFVLVPLKRLQACIFIIQY